MNEKSKIKYHQTTVMSKNNKANTPPKRKCHNRLRKVGTLTQAHAEINKNFPARDKSLTQDTENSSKNPNQKNPAPIRPQPSNELFPNKYCIQKFKNIKKNLTPKANKYKSSKISENSPDNNPNTSQKFAKDKDIQLDRRGDIRLYKPYDEI
jgi:hypothetical protein